jgi:hypothetical protein
MITRQRIGRTALCVLACSGARYERADLDQDDRFFAAQSFGASYHREALGLRFDLDISSALKLELANTHITDRTRDEYQEALMQYAVRF